MDIVFRDLLFNINDCRIGLRRFFGMDFGKSYPFAEVQIAGRNKQSDMGIKAVLSSERDRLKYVSHSVSGDLLTVIQESDLVRVTTVFEFPTDGKVFCAYTEVEGITEEETVLEDVSAFLLPFFGSCDDTDGLFFTRFIQGHHTECQPCRLSFADCGFFSNKNQPAQQKRISFSNVGSWSSKEELPQGIIEDGKNGRVLMFQIESSASWYYEISDLDGGLYLYLTGASSMHGGWYKRLKNGEKYRTPTVALALSDSLGGAIGEMTGYRRVVSGLSDADRSLPSIFNEYMHLSWDSPTEENTLLLAPIIAKTGVEYYVIDCGWHNEEPGNIIYPYVGQWMESKARFPSGVRATTDLIRSLGMKAGLWIEPEIVGIKCEDMLKYYDDDCFIKRYGKRIAHHGRFFLDYRSPKVVSYMTETIRRMVEDYGADYIKFDYNQDVGVGSDTYGLSFGEGLEKCTEAFLNWFEGIKKAFPSVIFEACASGGMRLDYKTLSTFSLVSTSDQTDYLKYPYIAGNILSAVIPEQAAVWSYPVGECKDGAEVTDDRIVMNMINSFLGRVHLASHLEYLSEDQLSLIKDGIEYYKSISDFKHSAIPFFPMGLTRFGAERVAAGLRDGKRILLAVWCLDGEKDFALDLGGRIESVKIAYPFKPNASVSADGQKLKISFERVKTAAFLEIELD